MANSQADLFQLLRESQQATREAVALATKIQSDFLRAASTAQAVTVQNSELREIIHKQQEEIKRITKVLSDFQKMPREIH